MSGEQGLLGVVADPNFANSKTLYFYASMGTDVANRHKILKAPLDDASALGRPRSSSTRGFAVRPTRMVAASSFTRISSTSAWGTAAKTLPHRSTSSEAASTRPTARSCGSTSTAPHPPTTLSSGLASVTGCAMYSSAFTAMPPDTRIYAWGLRNPFRFWIDSSTGLMWIGDVGEPRAKRSRLGTKGQHFGWPFAEGTTTYTPAQEPYQPANACMGMTPATACTPPVYDYGHATGACVIGGLIPSGCGWGDPWKSRYFFGDWSSGNVWTLDVNPARTGIVANSVKDFAKLTGPARSAWGRTTRSTSSNTRADGSERITPKGQAAACA